MANNESSHARNVANLQRANEANKSLGARYAPAREFIKVPVLDAYLTDCEAALTAAHGAGLAYNSARDARRALFNDLGRYATRIQKGLAATEGGAAAAEDARALALKIKGERASEPEVATEAGAGEVSRQISVSQTSFDNRLANFRRLVQLCSSLGAAYAPAEEDLKTTTLGRRATDMDNTNRQVAAASTAYSQALIARDRLLYDEKTGLMARMEAIRTYYEAAFGTGAPERKLLKGLSVRTLRNRRLAAV